MAGGAAGGSAGPLTAAQRRSSHVAAAFGGAGVGFTAAQRRSSHATAAFGGAGAGLTGDPALAQSLAAFASAQEGKRPQGSIQDRRKSLLNPLAFKQQQRKSSAGMRASSGSGLAALTEDDGTGGDSNKGEGDEGSGKPMQPQAAREEDELVDSATGMLRPEVVATLHGLLENSPPPRDRGKAAEVATRLHGVRFFRQLPRLARVELCRTITLVKHVSGATVFAQGSIGESFYIVLRGSVAVHIKPEESKEDGASGSMTASSTHASATATRPEGGGDGAPAGIAEEGSVTSAKATGASMTSATSRKSRDSAPDAASNGSDDVFPATKPKFPARRMSKWMRAKRRVSSALSTEAPKCPPYEEVAAEKAHGKRVALLQAPSSFGELALLRDERRNASVLAAEETQLIVVSKSAYEAVLSTLGSVIYMPELCTRILSVEPERRSAVEVGILSDCMRAHSFFVKLPRNTQRELCADLELATTCKGECIFRRGDVGDKLYILLEGTVDFYGVDSAPVAAGEKLTESEGEGLADDALENSGGGGEGLEGRLSSDFGGGRRSGTPGSASASAAATPRAGGGSPGSPSSPFAPASASATSPVSPIARAEAPSLSALPSLQRLVEGDDGTGDDTGKSQWGVYMMSSHAGDAFGEKSLMAGESRHVLTAVSAERCELMVLQRRHFQRIFGSSTTLFPGLVAIREALMVEPAQRSEETIRRIATATQNNAFFRTLDAKTHTEICRVARYQGLPQDVPMVLQGAPGDAFYVLLEGSVSVHVREIKDVPSAKVGKRGRRRSNGLLNVVLRSNVALLDKKGVQREMRRQSSMVGDLTELYGPCVIEMTSGQSFGELALIRGEPRGATVITATKSDFMVILKDDYDEVLQKIQRQELTRRVSRLRSIVPMRDWDEARLVKFSYNLTEVSANRDEVLAARGGAAGERNAAGGACVAIVACGACRVVSDRRGGRPAADLAVLGPGQLFGVHAALTPGGKQPFTVVASEECVYYTVTVTKLAKELGDGGLEALRAECRAQVKKLERREAGLLRARRAMTGNLPRRPARVRGAPKAVRRLQDKAAILAVAPPTHRRGGGGEGALKNVLRLHATIGDGSNAGMGVVLPPLTPDAMSARSDAAAWIGSTSAPAAPPVGRIGALSTMCGNSRPSASVARQLSSIASFVLERPINLGFGGGGHGLRWSDPGASRRDSTRDDGALQLESSWADIFADRKLIDFQLRLPPVKGRAQKRQLFLRSGKPPPLDRRSYPQL